MYGNSCKHPHTAGDFVESEVFQSRTTKETHIAFFVDESGTVTKEGLENVLAASTRPGQNATVGKQERGFGQPGNMFRVRVSKPHTRRTAEMFNLETLLVKGVELKKPAWWNRNKGRKKEEPRFEQATSDLRDKIRSRQLEAAGVDASLNKGVKREPEEWQEENLHHSRKRVKVEVKAEVKEEVDDGTISNLKGRVSLIFFILS